MEAVFNNFIESKIFEDVKIIEIRTLSPSFPKYEKHTTSKLEPLKTASIWGSNLFRNALVPGVDSSL